MDVDGTPSPSQDLKQIFALLGIICKQLDSLNEEGLSLVLEAIRQRYVPGGE